MKEEIIRCRDCQYVEKEEQETYDYFGNLVDRSNHYCCSYFRSRWNDGLYRVTPDGFCSWARKVD